MTLPENLQQKWDEATETGEPVEVGRIVVCDSCDADYTDRDDQGGIIFGSNAYCPPCTAKHMPGIIGYGEQHYIRATCPDGMSFADFIREERQRTGSTTIRVSGLQP